MQPISTFQTIIHTNSSLENAIKTSGGKEVLEKLFQSSIGTGNPFITTLEKHGVFKANTSFENNIELLVNTLLLAENRIVQKGKKAEKEEIQHVQTFGNNLQTIIQLAKDQNKMTLEMVEKNKQRVPYKLTSSMKKIEATGKKLEIGLTKLNELLESNQKAEDTHREHAEVLKNLQPYETLLKEELGLNVQFIQQLQKFRHTTANTINSYLTDLENIETVPPNNWVGSMKTMLGFGTQTEYGTKNRGSLARGIYTNIFNRLADSALEVRFQQTKTRFAEILEQAAQILPEAKMLKLVAKHKNSSLKKKSPELLQAMRACQLMKLREFINKAHFFAETKKKRLGNLNKQFNELYTMIGLSGNTPFNQKQLETITKAEIETLWNQVGEKLDILLSDKDGHIGWKETVVQGDTSAKSWNALVNEFVDGLESIS